MKLATGWTSSDRLQIRYGIASCSTTADITDSTDYEDLLYLNMELAYENEGIAGHIKWYGGVGLTQLVCCQPAFCC